jgi:flagellar motility protein MotE (MotC chaperone)
MTSFQQGSKQRNKNLKILTLRFGIFVLVTVSLLAGSALLDNEQAARYFLKTSYARTNGNEKKNITLAEKELLNSLETRKSELDRREELVQKAEQRIIEERKQIEQKLAEIKSMRDDISKKYAERLRVEEDRLGKMVKTFSNMKPAIAANVFQIMDIDLVVKIIEQMKGKTVAAILDKMSKDRATLIATSFTKMKDRGIKEK